MASSEEDDVNNIVDMANASVKGLNMTRHQLLHPTKEFMIDFLQKYLVSVDKTLAAVVKPNGEEGLLGEAMFSSGDDFFSLYVFVTNITKQFLIDYFNLTDICLPTNRSKTTVKLLVNLLLYMQSNQCVAKSIVDKYTSLLEQHYRINTEIDADKSKISELTSAIAQEEENYMKAKEEADAINKFTRELEAQKHKDEIEKIKAADELNNLDEILNQHEDYLAFLKNDVALLNSRVIDSNDFADFQVRNVKLEEKIQEMQVVTVENDKIICNKKTESERLESMMKLVHSAASSLDIIEKLEEVKSEIENEKVLSAKYSEQLQKCSAGLLQCTKEEGQLMAEIYSQNCKCDRVLAHIRDEQKSTMQESELSREHYKNLMVKCATEEEDLRKQCEESDKELDAIYTVENETYNNILQQENLLFTSFNGELQQLINKFSR